MSEFNENLKLIRMIRGLSVRQVAQKIGRSIGTISNWESGKISPPVDAIQQLCDIYDIPPNQLFGWENCPDIDAFKFEQQQTLEKLEVLKTQRSDIDKRIKEYTERLTKVSRK